MLTISGQIIQMIEEKLSKLHYQKFKNIIDLIM